MKYIYRLRSYASQLLLVFLMALILNSCNISNPGSPKGPRKKEQSSAVSDVKKIIFFLNGLWQRPEAYDDAIQNLVVAFNAEGLPIEIRNLIETATSVKTIDQQSSDGYEELKHQLGRDRYEIVLVGHSQGGLRGAKILSLNKEEGSPLDIRGLVTLGTPWEGAPGASITKGRVQSILDKKIVIYGLKMVNYVHDIDEMFTTGTMGNLFDHYLPTHEPGVQDMVPNSGFLQTVAASLANNDIPILSIAGVNTEAKSFLHYNRGDTNYMRHVQKIPPIVFNSLYSRFLAGGFYAKHDMMVPLDSQLAKNISKSNAFETYTIQGAIHDFLPGMLMPPDKVIYNHIEVIQRILEFTKYNCGSRVI
jgi:pimeloyl-ACP methyl ester carboxylesterase